MEEYFAHESAYIDEPVSIGKGTKIWHFSHIMSGAHIGENCNIGQSVYVGGKAKIGNGVKIQNNVSVYDDVELADYVFCGPSMVFTNDRNPRSKYPKTGAYVPTKVGYGASLGANCTVVCGNSIGKWAFIGAGSVITRNVPDFAVVYGNPARIKGWICECGEMLTFENGKSECKKCKRLYTKQNETVTGI
ncbi:MAG: N-acetyltransferase [Candidatus Margulisiibacteriota bacterium]|nr:MAG: hypothetical protein A2X43_05800 [Candidatus Margulisbacteria bacterium GWD2_39_127]OGI01066.1 MAG: hypothetical protein A2X42_12440 [Candidatus Margulisbacteria bacterium GWF2_38_17]PZM82042.1 MAG: N-acetyltransferase [Candidatus Margulisiibacteriota bacterium]HCY35836.1 N-acetyltransferase [Candidatus Margulisiibacteriota bacterium]